MQVIMMSKDGCGTCTTFAPVAKALAEERGIVFKVIKNPDVELPFFPYYYLMRDGEIQPAASATKVPLRARIDPRAVTMAAGAVLLGWLAVVERGRR